MTISRRICVVTSSRADYSRCRSVCEAILATPSLELQLIVTGSHGMSQYGDTVREVEADGLPITEHIPLNIGGATLEVDSPLAMALSAGLGVQEFARCFGRLKPDVVIAVTDRFETLAVATAAVLSNIVLGHIQGGERTGTIDESIRHAVTKMAHLHFVATEQSKRRVIRMGENRARVWNVGCPATDLLLRYEVKPSSRVLPYLQIVQHPVTTEYGESYKQMQAILSACIKTELEPIILCGNHDAGNEGTRRAVYESGLPYFATVPHDAFVHFMRYAACMVGNSSAGIREACYFGTPVVNVGTRQNGRERGSNVIDALYDTEAIHQAIQTQLKHGRYPVERLFGDGAAGTQITEILAEVELPSVQKRIMY